MQNCAPLFDLFNPLRSTQIVFLSRFAVQSVFNRPTKKDAIVCHFFWIVQQCWSNFAKPVACKLMMHESHRGVYCVLPLTYTTTVYSPGAIFQSNFLFIEVAAVGHISIDFWSVLLVFYEESMCYNEMQTYIYMQNAFCEFSISVLNSKRKIWCQCMVCAGSLLIMSWQKYIQNRIAQCRTFHCWFKLHIGTIGWVLCPKAGYYFKSKVREMLALSRNLPRACLLHIWKWLQTRFFPPFNNHAWTQPAFDI